MRDGFAFMIGPRVVRLMHWVAQMPAGVKFGASAFDRFIFQTVNFF